MTQSSLSAHRFAVILMSSTLFLLFAGALVTSTGSSLSVPDWPLSFGTLFPKMTGGVFYEHGHRLIAGAVSLMTLGFAVFLQKTEPRTWVRRLGWAAFGAIILQAVLGGVTVLMHLPPAVSISHAGLAELFFALTVTLFLVTSPTWENLGPGSGVPGPREAKLRRATLAVACLLYLQILLGALTRHLGAGLAIPDFPLNLGRVIPPLDDPLVVVHFLHRLGAYACVGLILYTVWQVMGAEKVPPVILRAVTLLGGLLSIQFTLGILVIVTRKNAWVTSTHLATGAALWGTAVYLAVAARQAWGSGGGQRSAVSGRQSN